MTAVCPGCAEIPLDRAVATAGGKDAQIQLSLPGIHCAGCISGVERTLMALPGVGSARVNLTLKRATVETTAAIAPETLVQALGEAGYEARELDAETLGATTNDARGRDLLMRLAVAFFAMMNVMLLSVAVWSGATDATRDLFHWISAAIALPTIAFSAVPFFQNAWSALSVGRLNMDVPISLAILLAGAMSVYETSVSGHHAYFDAALSLTFFLLLGRYLDHRTRAAARSAAGELAALEVPRALRHRSGADETVAVADLQVGDVVRVLPGGRMPVDGVVVEGASELDRSLLTGESLPVATGPGADVSAGEVNLTGPLLVEVRAAGTETSLHRMAELVAVSESARNRYTSLADRAAQIYAPVVHLLALFAFAGWWYGSGDLRLSLNIAVATLIITCPCALGLAVPAVSTAASGRLFRRGLLIKNGTALERLAEIDTVVFDKTGTLTEGRPVPVGLEAHAAGDLALAAALAQNSSHPLAVALADAARSAGTVPARISDVREHPGYGVEATFEGQTVRLGRADWVGATPVTDTATYLAVDGVPRPAFRFEDQLRPGSAETVAAFKADGIRVALLSGDTSAAVARLAEKVGIETWRSDVLPAEKADYIATLTAEGSKVLMVGDGLNDTAALAAAHVSVSPASALDAARVVSDIVLLGRDLAPLTEARRTAVSATRRIRENFGIAAAYNMIAIPVALAGFATPLAAALAMSTSSITVSLNALRLR